MTCQECSEQQGDYVDDELSPADRLAFEAHLQTCASCTSELADLRALLVLAGRLPKGLSGDDRWLEVSEQMEIRASPGSSWWRGAGGLAAAAVLIAGGFWMSSPGPQVVVPAPGLTESPAPMPTVVDDLQGLVHELEARVAVGSPLDPQTAATVQENLRTIDEAIGEIERALAEHPEDPALQRSLTRAYRHKIGVLSIVVRT